MRTRRLSSNGNFWLDRRAAETFRVCSHSSRVLHQRGVCPCHSACAGLVDRAQQARAAFHGPPCRAVRHRGCCSTGKTTGATPARHPAGRTRCRGRRRPDQSQSGTGNRGSRGRVRSPRESQRRNLPASVRPGGNSRASGCRRSSGGADRRVGPTSTEFSSRTRSHRRRRVGRRRAAAGRASPVRRDHRSLQQRR